MINQCFQPKNKLNRIKILIFKAIIGSYINHDEFVLVNSVHVLIEYKEIQEEIRNPENTLEKTT